MAGTETATCASPSRPAEGDPPAAATPADVASDRPPPPATAAAPRPPLARRVPPTAARSRPGGVAQPRRRAASAAADESNSSATAGRATTPTGLTRSDALREFLSCVAEEIRTLVAAFHALPAEEHRFASFKTLWLARRQSTMFHVEFWDSSATETHHAVLQVALELLVSAVHDAVRDGEATVHVGTVLGHVFALYCSFYVQVSEPKIKIAVDPSMWQALTQLSGLLMRQLTLSTHTRGVREALAMVRRLEHEDDAFLKCLGGSVGEFRLRTRRDAEQGPATVMRAPAVVPEQRDEEKQDMVMRLEALSIQYNAALKALSQVDLKGDNSMNVTASNTHRGGGVGSRGHATPSFLRKSRPVSRMEHEDTSALCVLAEGLWSDARDSASGSWMARLRRSVIPQDIDDVSEGRDGIGDQTVNLFHCRSDRDSLILDESTMNDMDAALLALEQELARDDAGKAMRQEQNIAHKAPGHSSRRNARNPPFSVEQQPLRPERAMSVTSSAQENDELDQLEAELMEDISTVRPVQTIERTVITTPENWLPLRTTRTMSIASSAQESDGLDELEAELVGSVLTARPAQRTRRMVTATPKKPFCLQETQATSIVSSGHDSDGLEDLEAELAENTSTVRAAPPVGRTSVTVRKEPVRSPTRLQVASESQRNLTLEATRTRRAMSVVSSNYESDGLDDLEAELEHDVSAATRPTTFSEAAKQAAAMKTASALHLTPHRHLRVPLGISAGGESSGLSSSEAGHTVGDKQSSTHHNVMSRQPAARPRVTRSRASSFTSSGQESDDGLDDLNRELEQNVRSVPRPRASGSRGQTTVLAQRGADIPSIAPDKITQTTVAPNHGLASQYLSLSSEVGSGDEMSALQRELDAIGRPGEMTQPANTKLSATSRKRPAPGPSSSVSRPRKQVASIATSTSSPPGVRRSRRLSIASSTRTETDTELAALEEELSMGPTSRYPPVQELPKPTQSTMQHRPRGLSTSSAMTETDDELKLLEAELAAGVGTETAIPVLKPETKPRAKTPARPRVRQPRTVSEAKQPAAKKKAPAKPRIPRQPKAATARAQSNLPVDMHVPTSTTATSVRQSDRGTSRRSVASSYDSDGLDDLENELRAFQ